MDSIQCVLEKPLSTGVMRQISWLPAKFAIKNKFVMLLEDGKWDNGWKIVNIGGRMTREQRIARGNDHNKQRDASDI